MALQMEILKTKSLELYEKNRNFYRCNGFNLRDYLGGPEERKLLDDNFEAREDDIYVVSFPKTGTTWAREMVYVIANDLDFDKAKSTALESRFPLLELRKTIDDGVVSQMESPRFITSHYPYSILPKSIIDKKCKIIYTIRNPKDTCVSYYHFRNLKEVLTPQCDFEGFFNLFIEDLVPYGPIWKHQLEFWDRRGEDNILILFYEDMKRDAELAIEQIASFLGKNLSKEEVQKVAEHCEFKNMKTNFSTKVTKNFPKGESDFLRKGEVGDWRNYFTPEMNETMEAYIEKHYKGTGINFQFEL